MERVCKKVTPKFKDFTDFLRDRSELLEDLSDNEENKPVGKTQNRKQNNTFCHSTIINHTCSYCKESHLIYT